MPSHQIELLRNINTGRPSWNKGKTYDHLTQEERDKKFGSHNLGNSYNKDRKHSEAYKKAISERMDGKPNMALYKPILQYSNDGLFIKEYPSIKHASEETGLSGWTIGCIAKGKMRKPHKFIFKYQTV